MGAHNHSKGDIKAGASGAASYATKTMKQPTFCRMITKVALYPPDSSNHKQLVDGPGEFIHHSLQLHNIVDEPYSWNLVEIA